MKLITKNGGKIANRYCEVEESIFVTKAKAMNYMRHVVNESAPQKSHMLLWTFESIFVVDLDTQEVLYTQTYKDANIYSATYIAKYHTLGILFFGNNEPYLFDVRSGKQLFVANNLASYEAIACLKNEILVLSTPSAILFFSLRMEQWNRINSIAFPHPVIARDLICW